MTKRFTFLAIAVLASRAAEAQAWNYPAFQPPRIESREFNFALADAGSAGTTLLVQWRELAATRSQFTLEAGIVAPDLGDNILVLGAGYAYQAHRSDPDVPLDVVLTAGAGVGLGRSTTIRVPLGASFGYRFELERNIALTPYVHPRLSADICNNCRRNDDLGFGINFDVGANLDVTRSLSLRAAALFGGGDLFSQNGLGISLAIRPPGLRR
ncbi:MAG: hypothetical protein JNL26_20590 [Gemmatimonadetes bacterium]|nr:hypothetical protein [Gemmatimonadota bacterium]